MVDSLDRNILNLYKTKIGFGGEAKIYENVLQEINGSKLSVFFVVENIILLKGAVVRPTIQSSSKFISRLEIINPKDFISNITEGKIFGNIDLEIDKNHPS